MAQCPTWPAEFAEMYRRNGCWSGETFGDLLRDRAVKYSEKIAIVSGERELTYRQLDNRADRLAAGLMELGIKPMDRIILQVPNQLEFMEIIFALFRIGALPVFALPLHRKSEIAYLCELAEAAAYIIPDTYAGYDYRELAREVREDAPNLQHIIVIGECEEFIPYLKLFREPVNLPQVHAEDAAFFQLSGGSTGLPKLIPRTHNDYIYSLHESVSICRLDTESVYLAALPAAHNFTLSSPGVLGTIYAGGKVVLAPDPSPDTAFALIHKEKVTITAIVPPLALIWLDAAISRKASLTSLQVLQIGGAKLNAEVARRIQPELGCRLQQVFGMAEGLVNYTRLDDPDELVIYTQGRPMSPYDELRVVDEDDCEVETGVVGHLLTRGPYTIRGYYRAEEQNAKSFTSDGYYRTGDLVKLTSEGYLIVEGRVKDQVNRGGEKISSEEIENHLLAHGSVHDAALVAIPDPYLGERSCAFVIPREQSLTKNDITEFLRSRGLSGNKIPDRIEFVDDFPKTAVGKVSKKTLRESLIARLQTED